MGVRKAVARMVDATTRSLGRRPQARQPRARVAPRTASARAVIRRQPQLAIVIGLALVGFGAYGFSTGAKLTAPYLVIVAGGALLVGATDRTARYSRVALIGLALWGIGHLAG